MNKNTLIITELLHSCCHTLKLVNFFGVNDPGCFSKTDPTHEDATTMPPKAPHTDTRASKASGLDLMFITSTRPDDSKDRQTQQQIHRHVMKNVVLARRSPQGDRVSSASSASSAQLLPLSEMTVLKWRPDSSIGKRRPKIQSAQRGAPVAPRVPVPVPPAVPLGLATVLAGIKEVASL